MGGMYMHSSIQSRLGAGTADAPLNFGADSVINPPPMVSVSTAAFGPTASSQAPSGWSLLHPATPTGMSVWVGAGALIFLIVMRQSLPA